MDPTTNVRLTTFRSMTLLEGSVSGQGLIVYVWLLLPTRLEEKNVSNVPLETKFSYDYFLALCHIKRFLIKCLSTGM